MPYIHSLETISDGDRAVAGIECTRCGNVTLFNRKSCPACASTSLIDRIVDLDGIVNGSTVVVKSRAEPWSERVPYGIAHVRLRSGPNVVAWFDAEDTAVAPGDCVSIRAEDDTNVGGINLKVIS